MLYYTYRDKPQQSQFCQQEHKVNLLIHLSESLLSQRECEPEQKEQKPVAIWQLKRRNSIIERNSVTQSSPIKMRTRRSSIATACDSVIKTARKSSVISQNQIQNISNLQTIKKQTKEDTIDEQSRRRLSRFLGNYEITKLIQKRSISRQDNPIYAEDIDRQMVEAQIKSIQNQQIRFQFHQSNKQILEQKKYDSQVNDMINQKQSTFNSVYQQIQNLTNLQRKKKMPITSHKLLKQKTKLLCCKGKIREKLQNIFKQVLFVAKYKCKFNIYFDFPLKYNEKFYENIIEGNFEIIQYYLKEEPYLIHCRNKEGQTPLHLACICNNAILARLFIKSCANIEALDNKQLSPLFYAFKADSNDCFKILLHFKARPWSPPGGKLNQDQMNVVQKNLLMHARLIYMFTIWKIKK